MAGAAVLFSIMALLVKLAGERLPATQIVLARAVVSLILAYGVLRRGGISPWGTHQGLLILRGLLGFGALLCFFYALTQLPLAEATVIQFMNPVFATLLAAWILRERAGRPEGAALILGLAGVLLITRPEWLTGAAHDNRPLLAVGIALAGSVLSSGAYVTVRRLAHLENPHVIVFYFPLVTLPLVLPLVWTVWIWPTPAEWAMLLGIGVATQIAQVWMTRALHAESTGRATSAGYLQILFASFWGFLFFGERPDLWFLAGALCIGAGVGWVAFRKPT